MGIQINGNNDIISALDGSWTAEGASINTSGILTATTFEGNVTGTACTFVDGNFTGNVTIGGTLTYEDVTNIDSVGLITARDGIEVTGGNVSIGDAATHTYGAHAEGDDLVIGGAGWRGMTIYGEGGGGVIQFADNASNRDGQIIYSHGDRELLFRTAGNVNRFKIGSDGTADVIGTSDGVLQLDTSDSRGAFIRFGQDGSFHHMVGCADGLVVGPDKEDLGLRAKDNMVFCTNGPNEKLRITSGGNVNIGGNFAETSHPLNVSHSTKPSLAFHTGTTLRADFSATTGITSIRSYANSPFTINTGGSGESERLHIASDGKIGINRSSNLSSFGRQVLIDGTLGLNNDSGNVGMGFHSGTSNCYGYLGTGDWAVTGGTTEDFGIAAKGNLIFGTSSGGWSEKLRIDSNGKTTSYGQIALSAGGAERFNISHTSGGNVLVKNPTAANITFQIQSNSNQLELHNNGRVGMGIGSPDGKLHVHSSTAGSVTADAGGDELVLESSGNTGLSILSPGTGESTIFFGNPGTNGQKDGYIRYYHETHSTTANRRALVFITGGGDTERLRITSEGQVKVVGANSGNHMTTFGSNVGGLTIDDVGGQHTGLEVSHGSNKVFLVASSNNSVYFSSYGTGSLIFEHTGGGGTRERFVINSSGQKVVKNGNLNILSTYIDFSGSLGSVPATAAAIYRPADNTLAVSTANTEKLKIDGSGTLYHKPSGNTTNAYLKAENTSTTYILKAQKDGAVDTNLSFNVQDGGTLKTLLYLRGDNKTVAVGPNITPARNLHVQEHFLVANIGTNGGQPYVSSTPILSVGTDGSNVVPGDATYRNNALVSFGVGGHNAGNPASNNYSGACPALPYFKIDLYGRTGVGDVGSNLDSTLSIRSINPNNTRLRIRTKDNYNGTYPDASISFVQQQSTEIARILCDTDTGAANMADLVFYTNYGGLYERLRITKTGDIQLSNNSGNMLDCRTSAGTGSCYIQLSKSDGTQKGYFGFGSGSSEQLYIVQQENADITVYTGSASRWYYKTDGQYDSATNGGINVYGGAVHHTNDAVIFCDKTSNADWCISANTGGYDYGIYTRVGNGAAYGLGVYDHSNSTWRFRVQGNGSIYAQNTSISSISDQRLKENIVDANSQWDDVKALRFRNFKWKSDSGYADGKTYLGLISQEVETISPGLVDINAQTKEDIENGVTDPEYKNVKYSIVWMKAMKALQEAQARIETLEAKVATLEGS